MRTTLRPAALKDLFADEGIEVLLASKVRRVEGCSGDRVRVYVNDSRGDRAIEGTDLLVAIGRKANSDGIGLDQTGVQLDDHGYIKTNELPETTEENIWATGDCAGSPQFTHVGLDDYSIVHANLSGNNRTKRNRLIPFCMFTDPEYVRVGKNEVEARRCGIKYRTAKLPMAEVLRTRTVSEPRGFMKVLVAKDSDEILGFTAFGFEASELMVAMQTARLGHLPYTVLLDAILTHPTMSEGLVQLLANVPAR
jgi:pyruvate/2-oxoglutarate dehydrogenase complex dihydrolipoamide dehydrogenase (E3) component